MNKAEQQKKAKRLFVIWILSVIPVYIYSGFLKYTMETSQRISDIHTILLIAVIGIYYFPMLLKIKKEATQGELKWLWLSALISRPQNIVIVQQRPTAGQKWHHGIACD